MISPKTHFLNHKNEKGSFLYGGDQNSAEFPGCNLASLKISMLETPSIILDSKQNRGPVDYKTTWFITAQLDAAWALSQFKMLVCFKILIWQCHMDFVGVFYTLYPYIIYWKFYDVFWN